MRAATTGPHASLGRGIPSISRRLMGGMILIDS